MKKHCYTIIALLVCFITLNAQDNIKLKFGTNGEFKIVQFTDTHINFDKKSNLNVYQIVEGVINIEKPDFVIFTGDNVTESEPQEAYKLLEELFAKAKIPWAVVFGNHDGQSGVTREDLADYLSKLPYCMNSDDSKDEVYGYSNFILPVYGKSNKVDALLYCMDSNSNSTLRPTVSGYGWFDFSQINWYRKKKQGIYLSK